ncbi:MAG: ISAs1 family transposase [Bacteroides sp.]|nr:ISAs1 family transposase [Bacteroides sp.]
MALTNAFLVDQCLSLGQEKVDSKKNEIIAIPRLLDCLELHEGDIITIDAIGTQKDIVSQIVEKQADYLLEVKGNQPTLMKSIEIAMEAVRKYHECEYVKEFSEQEEGHGLIVTRTCRTCSDVYFLGRIFKQWEGIRTFGYIDNWRIDKAMGEDMTERHYFITSLENDPKRILKFKRKHWGIENGLHCAIQGRMCCA